MNANSLLHAFGYYYARENGRLPQAVRGA